MYELSSAPGCRRQDLVQPHVKYSGTSRNGCTFVEGQRCLSPESAERFLARGTLKVVDKTRPREYFPRADELRAWLLQVKFDPDGKAYPNLAKGEKPILDTSCASPPMPADVHADLSEWFEKEWQGAKPPRNIHLAIWSLALVAISVFLGFLVTA
ncbi:hypothetical protein GGS24DRAFT_485433 [Hypoxylon argillaceum]|nr:hypothetical protein GGS24DRAFT_485433 [Hypoxylon argillaceum]